MLEEETKDNIEFIEEPSYDGQKSPETKDNKVDFSLYLQLSLFLVGLAGLQIIAIILSFTFLGLKDSDEYSLIVNYVSYFITFTVLIGICTIEYKKILAKLKDWKNWVIGIAIGIMLIIATAVISIIISLIVQFDNNNNEQTVRSLISLNPLLSVLVIGIMAPFCEELTYRVGLFSLLNRKNKILAYVVTIVVFAFIHFDFTNITSVNEWLNLPIYLSAGFILTFAYDYFGPAACITAHCINNLYSVLASLII